MKLGVNVEVRGLYVETERGNDSASGWSAVDEFCPEDGGGDLHNTKCLQVNRWADFDLNRHSRRVTCPDPRDEERERLDDWKGEKNAKDDGSERRLSDDYWVFGPEGVVRWG